jgi:propanediol dehydratase large subunit
MAVTITYLYPSASVPTTRTPGNMVVATIQASAALDTSAVITHQFNFGPDALSSGFPMMVLVPQDGNEITSAWYEASENPNYTILQKNTTAAGGLEKVFLSRPNSLTR